MVISSSKGIKIATEEEFDRYIKKQYESTVRKLARIYKMAKKANRHKQMGIDGDVVDAFLNNFQKTIDK